MHDKIFVVFLPVWYQQGDRCTSYVGCIQIAYLFCCCCFFRRYINGPPKIFFFCWFVVFLFLLITESKSSVFLTWPREDRGHSWGPHLCGFPPGHFWYPLVGRMVGRGTKAWLKLPIPWPSLQIRCRLYPGRVQEAHPKRNIKIYITR